MLDFLIRRFVKNPDDTESPQVRYAICQLCGYVGIVLNLFLFASKYLIGFLVGSVAIKGDAVNNLTDALNNIISIASFKISQKPADKEHPYGHERTETIASLFMGVFIIYLGIEMLRQSVEKILSPGQIDFKWYSVAVLVLSLCIKLVMFMYNNEYARRYGSPLLKAAALDSRNDMIGTTMVLISTCISPLINFDLDGYMGLVVSLIIFSSAWSLMTEVISRLLGEAPSEELLNELVDKILENPEVIDVHDVIIHTYGPGTRYATAHAEVDGSLSLIKAHDIIDRVERQVDSSLNVSLVIHVDPILLEDRATGQAADAIRSALDSIDPDWEIQDFQLRKEDSGKKLVFFDLIVPYEEKRDVSEITEMIKEKLPDSDLYELTIRLVHPYS